MARRINWSAPIGVLFMLLTVGCFYCGDRREHYNGYLVALGWILLIGGIVMIRQRPTVEQIRAVYKTVSRVVERLSAVAVILFLGWLWLGDGWHSAWRYSIQYDVPQDRVSKAEEPHDCEFMTAPLGSKNCHYELRVHVVRTAISTTGDPIVSSDNGKTWVLNKLSPPAKSGVDITWEKIEN